MSTVTSSILVGSSVAAAIAALVGALIAGVSFLRTKRLIQAAEDGDKSGQHVSTDSSWRFSILGMFAVTMAFAILAVLGGIRANTSSNITTTDVFTDISGAGALLGGLGTMLMFWLGYRDRQKRANQEANSAVLDHAIDLIGHPLQLEEIRALAELARALNGDKNELPDSERRKISGQRTDQSPDKAKRLRGLAGRELTARAEVRVLLEETSPLSPATGTIYV
jgi:hypothetical protein